MAAHLHQLTSSWDKSEPKMYGRSYFPRPHTIEKNTAHYSAQVIVATL